MSFCLDVKIQDLTIICATLLLILFAGCVRQVPMKEIQDETASPSRRMPEIEDKTERPAKETKDTTPDYIEQQVSTPDIIEEQVAMELTVAKTRRIEEKPVVDTLIPSLKEKVREKTLIEDRLSCASTDCHESVGKDVEVTHKPVADNGCTICHMPGWDYRPGSHSTYSFDIIDQMNLCLGCHEKTAAWLSGELYLHYPVRAGKCTSCHKPHGSNFKYILVKYQAGENNVIHAKKLESGELTLCLSCHRRDAFFEEDVRLTDFRDGGRNLHRLHLFSPEQRGCKGCHLTHASRQEKLMANDVPLGSGSWRLPIKYTRTESGGKCVVGCHRLREYKR